ncbi:hypothetical protein [Aliivibrio sifiae]|uniref:Uncharacterized protein n=1 Tax=Aliivibrio sifiae TaxID=566293 RepID=A0ABQ6AN23_9GAMM|nr:hypothetical protein [Aliivibrio sifiae]GLR75558.1 hypothetical protein GCM10007855_24320 [Aliivibrio sifiae]
MNTLDTSNSMVSDLDTTKKLPIQNDQLDDTVNTWDQLTEKQQQDILAHLTAIPFE